MLKFDRRSFFMISCIKFFAMLELKYQLSVYHSSKSSKYFGQWSLSITSSSCHILLYWLNLIYAFGDWLQAKSYTYSYSYGYSYSYTYSTQTTTIYLLRRYKNSSKNCPRLSMKCAMPASRIRELWQRLRVRLRHRWNIVPDVYLRQISVTNFWHVYASWRIADASFRHFVSKRNPRHTT